MSTIDELKLRAGSTIRPAKFHPHPTVKHSPVPRLFACNDPPSESKRLLILHTVENREKEIQDIDRRMKLSKRSCGSPAGQWATKKSIREEFIRLHKLLLSPIRVLPTEIWIEIFSLLHHSETLRFRRRCRWTLAQVCRSWRAIVLSMSHLWDTIIIDFSQPRSTLRASLKYLHIMLGRSSEKLLRISLISGPTSSSAVFGALADVIPACERWEEFSISAPYDVIVAFDRPPLKLPLLRRLDVKFWSDFRPSPPHEVALRSFSDCPVLHTASITGNGATIGLISRWHQLYSFGGCKNDLTTIQKFLVSYSQITCLSITIVPALLASDQQPLNMPSLRRINLFCDPAPNDSLTIEVGKLLLSLLTLPSVEEITINNLPETLIQDLKLLLKRSTSTRVKKLHLLGTPSDVVPPGSITELLELCPEVIDLELPLPPRKDLSNLILGQNPIHLVPGLRSLTFHNDVFEWNPGVMQRLAAFASSRCEPSTPSASPSCPAIHLRFPTEDACLDAFAMLHGVPVGYGRIYLEDVNETFCKVLNTLDAPCEENWVLKGLQNVKAAATKSTTILTQRLSYVIEFSEDAEYESIEALYRSKLHHAMFRFLQLNDRAIPGDQKHKFKERGLQTLRQWCKILLEDAPNCKWGFEPPSSLVYIPTGDPIRQSKLQSLKMFFGLDMASESLQCLISGED